MTLRFSTGARNAQASTLGLQGAFNRGYMEIYTGAQPVNADAAISGTLLGVSSVASGTLTKETRAAGTITITGASSGSINTITVGGLNIIPDGAIAVSGDTTSTLASKLADAINRNGMMEATVASNVVTVRPRPGSGAVAAAIAGSLTTVTATYVAVGTAVAGVAPVNGLILLPPVAGVISKSADVWSFSGLAAGNAGWFRYKSSDTADTGGASTVFPRIDGICGVGSGDAWLSSLAVSIGSPHTVDIFKFTMQGA